MKVVLFEDEPPGREKLKKHLQLYDSTMEIVAEFDSVQSGSSWLESHPAPDLIISDIQLADGLVFPVFEHLTKPVPIIFTTAFDTYVLKAFEYHSIDYLLKPITQEKVNRALDKLQSLQSIATPDWQQLAAFLKGETSATKRLIVRAGQAFKGIDIAQLAYAWTEHKVTFVMTHRGENYMADKTLQQLEADLPEQEFFRANRQFLVHHKAVASFRSVDKGKLQLELEPSPHREVLVSQERAGEFKAWLGG